MKSCLSCSSQLGLREILYGFPDSPVDVGKAEFSIFLAIHIPETSTYVFGSLNSAVILHAEQK